MMHLTPIKPSKDEPGRYFLGDELLSAEELAKRLRTDNDDEPALALVAPAEDLLLKRIDLDLASRRHINESLPWQFEDELAEPIEEMHFAVGGGNPAAVAIIRRQLLESWLQPLRDAACMPQFCVAEPQLLPPPAAGGWSGYYDGERLVLLSDVETKGGEQAPSEDAVAEAASAGAPVAHHSFCCPAESASTMLTLLLDQERPTQLRFGVDDESREIELRELFPEAMRERLRIETFNPLAGPVDAGMKHLVNLLQGNFSRKFNWAKLWRQAQPLAAAAAAALVIYTAHSWFALQSLRAENRRMENAIAEIHSRLYPDETAAGVADAQSRLSAELQSLRSTTRGLHSDFVPLLQNLGENLKTQAANATLISLNYASDKKILRTEIQVSNFGDIAPIRDAMLAAGVYSQLQNSNAKGDFVRARLALRKTPFAADDKQTP